MNKHALVIAVAVAIAAIGVAQAAPMKSGSAQGLPTSNSAQLSPAQRGAIVAQIVSKWGPYVQKIYRTNPGVWASRMQGTFAAANDGNLRSAAEMKTFQGMVGRLTGQQLSDRQVVDSLATQAQVLHSGPGTALLGSTTADLVYTPLAPCRIADTRNVGGVITGGTSRNFHGYTATNFSAQGGIATSDCGIPANPSALMINVAAPVSTQSGYLTVWPFGTTMPFASNLDYKAGDLANNEMAAKMTIGSATDEFSVFAFGTTNVVIDVVGYFMAPQATPLDVTNTQSAFTSVPDDGVAFVISAPACPATYSVVSTNCFVTADEDVINETFSGGCFFLDKAPSNGITNSAAAQNVCLRVPGR